ncbi:BCN_G0037310.mRNA.1.CDS.1 [Saccharomyces cerevisiae]|nr:Acs2p [Saccharomyces cerevisiae YJM1399]CAI4624300.1 BCN_G0037310.mRNA.1.CDS.1 [Saccharomyces cerevisiae]CAI4641695.1 ADE_G0036080.mRNA.1.CDS.1 [Saccharomyces cerevisiae]CAI4648640.1 BCE_3a_G0037330.mRNA.1.CDS.1 [Saccharomyces cerevisiae]CAI6799227.1 ADE_G0036080.mRNA.1.CDS.1 [Saccharomyces cerevisiae]
MTIKEHKVVHEAHNVKALKAPQHFYNSQPGKGYVTDMQHYQEMYQQSINEPEKFFDKMAKEYLHWDAPYTKVQSGSLNNGDVAWFLNGKLNASYNCVDRHAFANPDKPALIYEADDESDNKIITFGELLRKVSQIAGVLKSWGVKKGDTVAIYLPMIPEAVIAMLAVARIGAIHSVVFAGFSAGSLKDRVVDANSKVVITCDEGKRGGKTINTKKIVDEGLNGVDLVSHILVFQRTGTEGIPMKAGRDYWWHEEAAKQRTYLPPVSCDAEDPLFLLYTSGSTGSPKGVVHTTGGYLLGAALTTRYVFDIHPEDVLFTAGDVGWITGHTYALYGPLTLGTASIIFESTPAYPDYGRYWRIIQRHKATHFYVAPTALRLIKRVGEAEIAKYDTSSLRVLGSVGEPISPDLWEWYHEKVGNKNCVICDTMWQTESGSHLIAPLAGAVPTKPGSATVPFFGINACIIDPVTGVELEGNDVEGVLAVKSPWPSMARSVWNHHDRYMDTYLKPYPGHYFTGDGAGRDHDGYYWIRGRVDDVVNVSGHRLSTSEIEASISNHENVSEAAVVGIPDELTGQTVVAYVSLKDGYLQNNATEGDAEHITPDNLRRELILQVRGEIGPFASPKTIILVRDLPRTRSGKIMRRVLRKVASNEAEQLGDLTTLANPEVVPAIISAVENQFFSQKKK